MDKKGINNHLKIVEAANTLFYQRGYDHTSFSQIAEEATIPRGNFYYYFKTKEDILEAVIEFRFNFMQSTLQEWTDNFSPGAPRLKRFSQMLRNEVDEVVRYGCPLGSLGTELGKSYPELQKKARHPFDIILNWLKAEFIVLGYEDCADENAMHLLSRAQGIVTIAHAYADRDFLFRETDQLDAWIDALASNTNKCAPSY